MSKCFMKPVEEISVDGNREQKMLLIHQCRLPMQMVRQFTLGGKNPRSIHMLLVEFELTLYSTGHIYSQYQTLDLVFLL